MSQEGYVRGFGQSAEMMPMVLTRKDMELVFDTIVNERVDQGSDDDAALASVTVTLSFEEFKKSLVRVASLCTVTSERVQMEPGEVADDNDRLLDTSGGEAPAEWDEYGNPIKYKTLI